MTAQPSPTSDDARDAAAELASQGYTADASDPAALRRAVELAVDYRGDVTITRRSSPQQVEGYIFDRRHDRASNDIIVRVIPADREERIAIALSDIARIEFTGRDTASGKSFETWVKKYIEKKLAGERASIDSEPLDEKVSDTGV